MVNGQVPAGSVVLPRTVTEKDGSSHSDYMLVQEHAIISGEELESAQRSADEYGRPAVSFNLTTRAGEKFGTFTEANVNKQLAIVLDNKIQSAPNINSRITNRGIIQGQFTIEEANDLAVMLQSGALPAGLRFLQQTVVGPGLGLDSIRKGMTACLVAAALIVVFVLFYYRLSGVNAVVALALNMLFLMAIMSYFQATLTLPGIAGIVLSIGMAVDANVLIFERIKEDLRMGKTVRSAIENGFKKAFYPIFDSNITTIIAATFLFWFGTGPVKGFAVTLIAGIVASLFTAVWVSHLIFDLVLSKKKENRNAQHLEDIMDIVKNRNIDFLKYKVPALILSLAIIAAGFVSIYLKHGLSYGVEFSGGTAIHSKFRSAAPLDAIRSALTQSGYKDSGVQGFQDPTEVLVRLPQKMSSGEDTGAIGGRVIGLMNSAILHQNQPAEKHDLNTASESQILQYLQLKAPFGPGQGDQYVQQVQKLMELQKANKGLFPTFEQMSGIDPKSSRV